MLKKISKRNDLYWFNLDQFKIVPNQANCFLMNRDVNHSAPRVVVEKRKTCL